MKKLTEDTGKVPFATSL